MEKHLYWSVISVQGGEEEVLVSVEKALYPYVRDISSRITFELTGGEEGLDDDKILDGINLLDGTLFFWDEFEKVPTNTEILECLTPCIKVDLDGCFYRQYMDVSALPENTSFLTISSDSDEDEVNEHCEVQEFLTAALAPLMTTKYSVGGWTSFSDGRLFGAGAYAFGKDGVEVPIQKLAEASFALT